VGKIKLCGVKEEEPTRRKVEEALSEDVLRFCLLSTTIVLEENGIQVRERGQKEERGGSRYGEQKVERKKKREIDPKEKVGRR
jgi:hypothetical protein